MNYAKIGLSFSPNDIVSRTHQRLRRNGQIPPDADEDVQIPEDPNKETIKTILGVCRSRYALL
jgi:hypothetical protein